MTVVISGGKLDRLKDHAIAQMKADGMEYEQRIEELEKLEYPKPLRDFVYDPFNAFADRHPWVGEENIRPKSIAREMFETDKSFAESVVEYDLERSARASAALRAHDRRRGSGAGRDPRSPFGARVCVSRSKSPDGQTFGRESIVIGVALWIIARVFRLDRTR